MQRHRMLCHSVWCMFFWVGGPLRKGDLVPSHPCHEGVSPVKTLVREPSGEGVPCRYDITLHHVPLHHITPRSINTNTNTNLTSHCHFPALSKLSYTALHYNYTNQLHNARNINHAQHIRDAHTARHMHAYSSPRHVAVSQQGDPDRGGPQS